MFANSEHTPKKTPEALIYTEAVITGVSLCDGKRNYYIPISPWKYNAVYHHLSHFFSSVRLLVAHNWVFDVSISERFGIKVAHIPRFDTMVAAHLLDENDKKGLKYLAQKYLGYDTEEFDEKLNHYSQRFYEYGLNDTKYTWELYQHFLPILSDEGVANLFYKIEMPFQSVLLEMKEEGILIDTELLAKQQDILEDEIISLETQLYGYLGERYTLQLGLGEGKPRVIGGINFASSQQLGTLLFERLGLDVIERTEKGQAKTNSFTLERYKDHPFVSILIKYKIARKLYDAFVSPEGQIATNLEKDNKLRPHINDVGTRTGRLSSSSPNCQQLPRKKEYSPVEVRKLFVAPPGYRMFSVDYSGQEIAVAAQVSKDPTLIKSLCNGYDMHLAIANQFSNLNIPEECLNTEHPMYEQYKSQFKTERTHSKTITFGLLYGKEAYGFSKDFGITEEEAQKIVDEYFKGMPELKKAIEQTHQELSENGYVVNLAGRKRRFVANERGYYPGGAFRQSFNFKVQGYSADMIRAAMVTVYKNKVKYPEWGLKTVLTVHDEAVYIVKEGHVGRATAFVKKCFENVCKNFIVPVNASVEVGDNYGEAK